MGKVKKFFEDYGKAWQVCNDFYKEHWLGSIIFAVVLVGVEYGIGVGIDAIANAIQRKRLEKELEEGTVPVTTCYTPLWNNLNNESK